MTISNPHVTLPRDHPFTDEQVGVLLAEAHSFARRGSADVGFFLDVAADDHGVDEEGKAAATAIFDGVISAWKKVRAERAASGVSSNIDRAFADLNAHQVVARGNFSCCGTCADSEIYAEAPEDGNWLGYVYFHAQDAENIEDTGSTYLGYGVNLPRHLTKAEWDAMESEARDAYYAEKVRQFVSDSVRPVLEQHGMSVTWDGDMDWRIEVGGITDYLVPFETD